MVNERRSCGWLRIVVALYGGCGIWWLWYMVLAVRLTEVFAFRIGSEDFGADRRVYDACMV